MNTSFAILLFLVPCYCNAEYSSFIASFQSLGHWLSGEYIEYKYDIPEMKVFTACHWEKIYYFSERFNTIWAYCQQNSKTNQTITCIELFCSKPNENGKVYISLYRSSWGHTKSNILKTFRPISYRHRHWNHFCLVYSTTTKEIKLYHNGKKLQTLLLENNVESSAYNMPKSTSAFDSAFIIGQEPDSMRGNFDEGEAFPGDISELNVWDRALDDVEITGHADCKNTNRGNVVTWNSSKFNMNTVKITNISDSEIFCIDSRQYLILSNLMTLEEATKSCNNLGGKVTVPHTKTENNKILSIFQEHKNQCLIKNGSEQAAWLGLKKSERSWHETETNGSTKIIDYSNWRQVHDWMYTLQNLCAVMYADGSWGYEKYGTCQRMSLCAICFFTEIRTFALKGRYQKTPNIERIYYMSINKSHQLEAFNGISRTTEILQHPNQQWYITESTGKTNQLLLADKRLPIGRNNWSYLHPAKTLGESLTLSICKFGKKYTCDSGECIDISRRCDKIFDCLDESDETSCDSISFPVSYLKAHAPSTKGELSKEIKMATKYIIQNIDSIDTMKMMIGVTISIQMYWNDHRITFNNLQHDQSYVVSEKNADKLWLPLDNTEHVNAILRTIKPGKKRYVTIYGNYSMSTDLYTSREENIFPGGKNSLSEMRTFQIYYNCYFDLKNYPFDTQLCVFGLDLQAKNDEKFIIIGKEEEMISYTGSRDVADFVVKNVFSNRTRCVGQDDNLITTTQELVFCIFIKRSHADQLVSIFCPSMLFWVLAYFTMFLHVDDVSNRTRTSVTLLLVLIALLQTVKKDFPKTTYYKYVDIWFLWYIFNIFMISICHIILPRMRAKFRQSINLVFVIFLPLVMFGFNLVYFILTT